MGVAFEQEEQDGAFDPDFQPDSEPKASPSAGPATQSHTCAGAAAAGPLPDYMASQAGKACLTTKIKDHITPLQAQLDACEYTFSTSILLFLKTFH